MPQLRQSNSANQGSVALLYDPRNDAYPEEDKILITENQNTFTTWNLLWYFARHFGWTVTSAWTSLCQFDMASSLL